MKLTAAICFVFWVFSLECWAVMTEDKRCGELPDFDVGAVLIDCSEKTHEDFFFEIPRDAYINELQNTFPNTFWGVMCFARGYLPVNYHLLVYVTGEEIIPGSSKLFGMIMHQCTLGEEEENETLKSERYLQMPSAKMVIHIYKWESGYVELKENFTSEQCLESIDITSIIEDLALYSAYFNARNRRLQ